MQWPLSVHDLLYFLQCIFISEESYVASWLRRLEPHTWCVIWSTVWLVYQCSLVILWLFQASNTLGCMWIFKIQKYAFCVLCTSKCHIFAFDEVLSPTILLKPYQAIGSDVSSSDKWNVSDLQNLLMIIKNNQWFLVINWENHSLSNSLFFLEEGRLYWLSFSDKCVVLCVQWCHRTDSSSLNWGVIKTGTQHRM